MSEDAKSFREQAAGAQRGTLAEFLDFVIHNKKWWLTPVIVVLMLIAAFVVVAGSGAAPFIYSLF